MNKTKVESWAGRINEPFPGIAGLFAGIASELQRGYPSDLAEKTDKIRRICISQQMRDLFNRIIGVKKYPLSFENDFLMDPVTDRMTCTFFNHLIQVGR